MANKVLSEITAYLDKKGVPYELIRHKEVYMSRDLAKACKVTEREVAKVLLIKSNKGKVFAAVLPANLMVKLKKIKAYVGADTIAMLSEKEMRGATACPPGAAPAIANIFGIPVYIDPELLNGRNVVFRGGTYSDSVKIPTEHLLGATGGEKLAFSVKPSPIRKKKKKPAKKKPVAKKKTTKKSTKPKKKK